MRGDQRGTAERRGRNTGHRRWLAIAAVVATMAVWRAARWTNLFGLPPARPYSAVAARILTGAKQQRGNGYTPAYFVIAYPNGDVPADRGACTDVVVRALRAAGFDLQQLIHQDMQRSFEAYPHQWSLKQPDANIDHRRVPNQMCFFRRHGLTLTTEVSPRTLVQWQPGDFVYWHIPGGQQHTGVVSDTRNGKGIPWVIHNGGLCIEQDCLTNWPIIGHFRYPKPRQSRRLPYPPGQREVASPAVPETHRTNRRRDASHRSCRLPQSPDPASIRAQHEPQPLKPGLCAAYDKMRNVYT